MAKRILNKIDVGSVAASSVMFSFTTTRPTSRTDIVVIFITATDPTTNALANDLWLNTA